MRSVYRYLDRRHVLGIRVGSVCFEVGSVRFEVGPVCFEVGSVRFEVGSVYFEEGSVRFIVMDFSLTFCKISKQQMGIDYWVYKITISSRDSKIFQLQTKTLIMKLPRKSGGSIQVKLQYLYLT